MSLTVVDIKSEYPSRYPITPKTWKLANQILDELWAERCQERLVTAEDRSGSCKFAALLVRDLFGGKLAGNDFHVFNVIDGKTVDINETQGDVLKLGGLAHTRSKVIQRKDYRDSLASCMPRVRRWVKEFERRYAKEPRIEEFCAY